MVAWNTLSPRVPTLPSRCSNYNFSLHPSLPPEPLPLPPLECPHPLYRYNLNITASVWQCISESFLYIPQSTSPRTEGDNHVKTLPLHNLLLRVVTSNSSKNVRSNFQLAWLKLSVNYYLKWKLDGYLKVECSVQKLSHYFAVLSWLVRVLLPPMSWFLKVVKHLNWYSPIPQHLRIFLWLSLVWLTWSYLTYLTVAVGGFFFWFCCVMPGFLKKKKEENFLQLIVWKYAQYQVFACQPQVPNTFLSKFV